MNNAIEGLMKVRIYLVKHYYLGAGHWTSRAHEDAHRILCEVMEKNWKEADFLRAGSK